MHVVFYFAYFLLGRSLRKHVCVFVSLSASISRYYGWRHVCSADLELGHWITGSMGHLGHLSSFWPGVRPEFSRFSKKWPNCKTYIWNAEMAKVIVGCLLLDWNHWMSVHAMNFYFYLWLLKILWPENTSSRVSRHLEFIIEQGLRVAGFPGHWVAGSQNVTQFHFC